MAALKASHYLRLNIAALLARDHVTPAGLALACGGKDRSWMTRFLNGQRHELQLADIEKIADFFGKQPYELFQPKTGTITDRRVAKLDRRSGTERRVGHAYRAMLPVAATVESLRRPTGASYAVVASPYAEKLARLSADYDRAVSSLLAQAESRGQTAPSGAAVAGAHSRRRTVRRPRPPKA